MSELESLPGPLKYKACTKCAVEFPLTAEFFYKSKTNLSGLVGHCKICQLKYAKIFRKKWNRKEWEDWYKQKNTKSPPNKDPEIKKICSLCNTEKSITEFSRRSASKSGFESDCYACKSVRRHNRRIKLLGSKVAPMDWLVVQNFFNNQCCYCYKSSKLTIDHFVPVFLGGTNSLHNLAPACFFCNTSKGRSNPYDWICKKFYPEHFMMSFDFKYKNDAAPSN